LKKFGKSLKRDNRSLDAFKSDEKNKKDEVKETKRRTTVGYVDFGYLYTARTDNAADVLEQKHTDTCDPLVGSSGDKKEVEEASFKQGDKH